MKRKILLFINISMVASLLYMCLLSGCSRRTIDNDVSGGAPDELREDVKQEEDILQNLKIVLR